MKICLAKSSQNLIIKGVIFWCGIWSMRIKIPISKIKSVDKETTSFLYQRFCLDLP